MYYVYSLKCKDGFYVGCTDDLKERYVRHQKGYVPATARRLPVELDFYIAVKDKYLAFNFEKYLKTCSGRAFVNKHLIK
jgi:predicted GIY-YIG superfamily endonuclease